ncbi:hypothetical protein FOPG_18140 [Fusarium oxysporum f. sp. conglutinans race 2 54008]|nr:hypothetical protein FOPG_18140 [Fusarium oxysporum f. sp. conglutinans race 2 54008]
MQQQPPPPQDCGNNRALQSREQLSNMPNVINSEAVTKSFEVFLSFVVTVTIFGAAIFTVVISEIVDPSTISSNAKFDKQTVRTFLAISWLLFVVALGLAAFSMSTFYAEREKAGGGFSEEQIRKWRPWGILASFMLQIMIIVAFLFLSLVLVAYTEGVGWVAVALSGVAVIVSFCFLFYKK